MAKAKGRALKGVFSAAMGALGFAGMSAAGFTPGAESDAEGVDGSTNRDAVSGALTVGSMFLPQLTVVANVYKSLTNHREVEEVTTTTRDQSDTIAAHGRRLKLIEKTLKEWEDAYSGLRCLVAAKNGFKTSKRVAHQPAPSASFHKLL